MLLKNTILSKNNNRLNSRKTFLFITTVSIHNWIEKTVIDKKNLWKATHMNHPSIDFIINSHPIDYKFQVPKIEILLTKSNIPNQQPSTTRARAHPLPPHDDTETGR